MTKAKKLGNNSLERGTILAQKIYGSSTNKSSGVMSIPPEIRDDVYD